MSPTLNHRIEDHQELAHAGNQGNLLRLASSEQTLVEGADDTVMRDGHDGRHVQAAAQVRSSAADAALAVALSRIAIQWSNANELGDLAAGLVCTAVAGRRVTPRRPLRGRRVSPENAKQNQQRVGGRTEQIVTRAVRESCR